MNVDFQTTAPAPVDLTLVAQPTTTAGESFHQTLAHVSSSESSKVADVGKQFEALIMGQVLKAARDSSDGGWLGTDDDQTGELTMEMAEQQFAQALAAGGALGIAKLVAASLNRGAARAAKSGSVGSNPQAPQSTDSTR